jgi:deoxycytidine triphosphate deaminase
MTFWSGEKLKERLSELVDNPDPKQVDTASYRLRLGSHVFVTSDKISNGAPGDPLVTELGDPPNHIIRIPPGQFAFLLTEETVCVPKDAMAFISMKARYKFQGLINVSGFHVDPGWVGKLVFSVYNAGPREILLERGSNLFMIVYADLDRLSDEIYQGESKNRERIDIKLIQDMTGQVFSPMLLQRKIDGLTDKQSDLMKSLENQKASQAERLRDLQSKLEIFEGGKFANLKSELELHFKWFSWVAAAAFAILLVVVPLLFTTWFKPLTINWIQEGLDSAGYELKKKSLVQTAPIPNTVPANPVPVTPSPAPTKIGP